MSFTTSGLLLKHMTIVNYASSVVSEQSFQLIDDATVIIYDRHVLLVQAAGHRSQDHYLGSLPFCILGSANPDRDIQ
jgi:hypothetical protein